MVNGGGAITLQFQRSPFRPMTRTVFVPWNQVNYSFSVAQMPSLMVNIFSDSDDCSAAVADAFGRRG